MPHTRGVNTRPGPGEFPFRIPVRYLATTAVVGIVVAALALLGGNRDLTIMIGSAVFFVLVLAAVQVNLNHRRLKTGIPAWCPTCEQKPGSGDFDGCCSKECRDRSTVS